MQINIINIELKVYNNENMALLKIIIQINIIIINIVLIKIIMDLIEL